MSTYNNNSRISSNSARVEESSKDIRHNSKPIEICLINYECSICMKIILEMRFGIHFHGYCLKCVPRNDCPEDYCKSMLIHWTAAETQDTQDKIMDYFKSLGGCVVKFVKTNKRSIEDETLE